MNNASSTRHKIELKASNIDAGVFDQGSEIYGQILSRAYYSTLRYYLNKGQQGFSQDSENNLYSHDEWLEGSVFFNHVTEALLKNKSVDFTSAWEVFRNPIMLLEFKLSDLKFSSHVRGSAEHLGGGVKGQSGANKHSIIDVLNVLTETYLNDQNHHTTDEQIRQSLDDMFAFDAVDFVDRAGKSDHEFVDTCIMDDGEDTVLPIALKHLLHPLVDHVVRHFSTSDEVLTNGSKGELEAILESMPLNSFNRAVILKWKDHLERAATGRAASQNHDPLSGYPFIYTGPLAPNSDYGLLLIVTQLDPWFLDERIVQDQRLPNIVMGIYDTRHMIDQSWSSDVRMKAEVMNAVSGIANKLTSAKRGQALGEVAGEAAEISRFWYGEGITRLMDQAQVGGGLDTIDVFDFWTDFVRELLCANIEGVENTEVFPFDRAYIVNHSGVKEDTPRKESGDVAAADDTKGVGSTVDETENNKTTMRVRVLEAALESRAAKDRFRHLSVFERGDRSLDEFIVTSKIIKHVSDLYIEAAGDRIILPTSLSDESRKHIDIDLVNHVNPRNVSEDDKISTGVYALTSASGLLARVNEARKSTSREADHINIAQFEEGVSSLGQRFLGSFDKEGFFYDYRHGLNLSKDVPALAVIDSAYKEWVRAHPELGAVEAGAQDSANNSKVVFISFDPGQSSYNKVDDKNLVPLRERFSLILVADTEPSKSELEMRAERKDLELLVRTILRQRLREKKLENGQIHKRIGVVENFVNSFFHRLKGMVKEEDKATVEQQWKSLQHAMRFDEADKDEFTTVDRNISMFLLDLLRGTGSLGFPGKDDVGKEKGQEKSVLLNYLEMRRDDILEQHGKSYVKRAPQIEIIDSLLPPVSLGISAVGVMEAFDVMFKNAVEAAASPKSPKPPKVTIQALGRPSLDARTPEEWSIEVIVANSTAPIDADVLKALQSEEPDQLSENQSKSGSTGAGVYSSRSQLRFGLGRDADIRYMPIGMNVLQAAMSLPGKLVDLTAKAGQVSESGNTVEDISASPTKPYVLYIEDEEANYAPSLKALNKAFHPQSIDVWHARDLKTARSYIQAAEAELLITDYNILPHPDATHATPKNGMKLVESFLAHVQDGGAPTAWIVTNEKADTVQHEITDIINACSSSYDTEIIGSDAAALCVNKPVVQIAGLKDFSACADDLRRISEDLKKNATQEAMPVADIDEKSSEGSSEASVILADITSSGFDKELEGYWLKYRGMNVADMPVMVVKGGVGESLPERLQPWFVHPGAPDLDELDDEAQSLYPLHNGIYHHRLLCHVEMASEELSELTPAFLHWCISKNVVLMPKVVTPETLGECWAELRHEGRGALSRIRHDIKNIRNGLVRPKDEGRLSLWDVEDITSKCEEIVMWDRDLDAEVLQAVRSGKFSKRAEEVAWKSEQTEQQRLELLSGLNDLTRVLRDAVESSGKTSSDTSKLLGNQIKSVSGLKKLLFPEETQS